jgi:DNA-binding transcriptional ArsR family regulator
VRACAASDLDTAFAALSDTTRRAVIQALLARPLRAGELAQVTRMSPPALSRHLRVLRKAGFVVEEGIEEDARVRVYRIDPVAFEPVRDWVGHVEQLWQEQLLAFKRRAERSTRSSGPGRER